MTLTSNQRAAILFMTLPPELSATIFNELSPTQVQAVTLTISQLPLVTPEERAMVVQDFLQRLEPSGQPKSPTMICLKVSQAEAVLRENGVPDHQASLLADQLAQRSDSSLGGHDALEELVRNEYVRAAQILASDYILSPPEAPQLRAMGPAVTRAQEAAIVLSTLSPTLAERLLGSLASDETHRATNTMAELPHVDSDARTAVAIRFMFRCDGTLHDHRELERFVSTNFELCAKTLDFDLSPPFDYLLPSRFSPWQRWRAFVSRWLG